MRFEEKELWPSPEPVAVEDLQVGVVYFAVNFIDKELLIPTRIVYWRAPCAVRLKRRLNSPPAASGESRNLLETLAQVLDCVNRGRRFRHRA
jgi:hypothetical protein